jgi:hypothetical protein
MAVERALIKVPDNTSFAGYFMATWQFLGFDSLVGQALFEITNRLFGLLSGGAGEYITGNIFSAYL